MAGEVLDLLGQLEHLRVDVVVGQGLGGGDRTPRVDLLRPGVLHPGGVAEGLGHVADRRLGPVGDDVGHLGGVAAPVALVHVLDGLLAPVALDVDVDVGRAVALGRQEPLEQQAERHGVGVGDAEGVADGRVGGRAPPLAVDVGPPAERDDVPHHQEVAGEAQRLDERQFVVDLGPCPWHLLGAPRPVAADGALLGEPAQVRHLVEPVGARERRQLGGDQRQVERALAPDVGRPLDHAGPAPEPAGLLAPGPQVRGGGRRQPAIDLVEAAPGPHGGQRGGQRRRAGVS